MADDSEIPAVDRSQQMLANGGPVTPDHREIDPATGMQKAYVVLTDAERAKGFVRPVRLDYRHDECGGVTRMGQVIAETIARAPTFYGGMYCSHCKGHFPAGASGEFTWLDSDQKVGS